MGFKPLDFKTIKIVQTVNRSLMRSLTNTKITAMFAVILLSFGALFAQDVTTVKATNPDISDNLDLEMVASIFGDAKDLEDFERNLNDPDLKISNLDLNRDGYVDYLRVVEVAENYTHLIAIQAVIGEDLYQDVATIEVEKDNNGDVSVQVVGDVYMYGPDYIIEPVYVYRPVIYTTFWRPYYRPYCSVYYWGYYPMYYRLWHPFHVNVYHTHIHRHINVHHTYHYVHHRRSAVAVNLHKVHRRYDYAKKHPQRTYSRRTGYDRNPKLVKSASRTHNTRRVASKTTSKRTNSYPVRAERSSGSKASTGRSVISKRNTSSSQRTAPKARTQNSSRSSKATSRTVINRKSTATKNPVRKQSTSSRSVSARSSQPKTKSVSRSSSSTSSKPNVSKRSSGNSSKKSVSRSTSKRSSGARTTKTRNVSSTGKSTSSRGSSKSNSRGARR